MGKSAKPDGWSVVSIVHWQHRIAIAGHDGTESWRAHGRSQHIVANSKRGWGIAIWRRRKLAIRNNSSRRKPNRKRIYNFSLGALRDNRFIQQYGVVERRAQLFL
jgi:hypothetical protein